MNGGRKVVLTHSEIGMLHACPWKHGLRFERQLDPVGFDDAGALRTGTLMHAALADVYRTIQRMQLVRVAPSKDQLLAVAVATLAKKREEEAGLFIGDFADEALERLDDDLATARGCIELFVEHIALRNAERYDVIAVEMPFRVPLLTPKGRRWGDELEGVMDLVLRDRALGTIVLGEHKSTAGEAHAYETRLQHDTQAPLYTYALGHIFGELARGEVVLNVVRKTAPRAPSINADGTVSIAAVDTTRAKYEAACAAQGEPVWLLEARAVLAEGERVLEGKALDKAREREAKARERWAEIQMKQRLRAESLGGIERFVQQHEFRVSAEQVQRAAYDAWTAARLVRLFRRGELKPWRNGANCRAFGALCAYHSACVEDVIEPGELLVKREHRHREVEEARNGPSTANVARMMEMLDAPA